MKQFKKFQIAAFCMLSLLVLSCSKSDTAADDKNPPPPGNDGNTINITSSAFPASTTVKKGTTVKWNNQDNMAHTVTSDDGSTFDSGNVAVGASFSYVANKVGTFDYHCNYHSGMTGKLIVTN